MPQLDAAPRAIADGKNWDRAYASPDALARVVVGLLATVVVIDLIGIATLQARIGLVEQVRRGVPVTNSQLVRADDHASFALGAWFLGLVATAVFFVWWFQRLYGNLAALGVRDLRFGHGWSIGAWFTPFVNLLRPAQIAQDIWQASDPALSPSIGPDWRSGGRSAIVGVWWIAFIGSGVVDRVASSRPTTTADEVVSSDHVLMVSNLVDAAAAALAIVFVLQLTRRQRTRVAALAAAER